MLGFLSLISRLEVSEVCHVPLVFTRIQKIINGKINDCAAGSLLDYQHLKKIYKMRASKFR